jgi:hypothetical protein
VWQLAQMRQLKSVALVVDLGDGDAHPVARGSFQLQVGCCHQQLGLKSLRAN